MLGAAGNENPAVAEHAGHQPADRAADMPLGVDIGVVQHGMALAAHGAAPVGFAFHQHAMDARGIAGRQLRRGGEPEIAEHGGNRSEEHTSELQSLMRISYAVFCLKKKILSSY